MVHDLRAKLPERPPPGDEDVRAAVDATFTWRYGSGLDELLTLYADAVERQWSAVRDLDWSRPVDRDAFSRSFSPGGVPISDTEFWRALSPETRWEVARRSTAFLLSNFLHGEQGALMVASQLVSAVPHMEAKLYAATQTLDEARHVEVFAAYIARLGDVHPIAPGLKALLDNVLEAGSWKLKAVGMQVVTEGLALHSFRDMRNATREPLLRQILTYVSRDEARHTSYGIRYLGRVVPTLPDAERAELEDFAFESARLLIDSRAGVSLRGSMPDLWRSSGVDPAEAVTALVKERGTLARSLRGARGRRGPVSGFVIPTLKAIGLYSDRIRGHFRDMWAAELGDDRARWLSESVADLPKDLEAWVERGARAH